jgi:peptidoglycan/LPS O-acetylase OafA/YrhL
MRLDTNQNFSDTKKHYEILDGLRGVAAIMVVAFHIMEASANGNRFEQIINHGYLAVDFFFLLSGFVIGYAYDERWSNMTLKGFFTRRLVRLHPMVVMGMIVGAIGFYFQQSNMFPIIATVPVWKMLLIMIIGFTLIPVPPSMDIRGWQEMHPLNGPAWSLFFEYVANIIYAVVVRRFSNLALAALVVICGVLLMDYALTGPTGDMIGGWSIEPVQFKIGFIRMMYPFFTGLLLSRIYKPSSISNAFMLCSLLLIIILSLPRFGDETSLWKNGLYESLIIIFAFPAIVWIGASGKLNASIEKRLCSFMGDISYPLYITHYPIIYIYTAWVVDNKIPFTTAMPYGILVLVSSILLAYACLKLYDEPVRKWLAKRFVK